MKPCRGQLSAEYVPVNIAVREELQRVPLLLEYAPENHVQRAQGNQAYDHFPALQLRQNVYAGSLSGGEQQMLSLAPALVKPPVVLIADEPTLGLAPLIADEVINAINEVKKLGTAVLLVEEHAQNALRLADVIAFIELGEVKWVGPREEVNVDELSAIYLGGG